MVGEMGTRIRNLRLSLNLKQEELAEALKISPGYCGLIERNERGTSYENLEKLCSIFNVTADYLLFGKGEPPSHGSKDINTFFNEVLHESERVFIIEVMKGIVIHRFSEEELGLLLQAIQFQTKYLNQVKKSYEPSAE